MQDFLREIVIPFFTAQAKKSDNFVLYSTEKKVITASDGVLKKLGCKQKEDLMDKKFHDFNYIKPDFIVKLECIFQRVLDNKNSVSFIGVGGQLNPRFKNYHELIFQRYNPIFDLSGNIVAIIAQKLPTINYNLFNLFFPEYKVNLKITDFAIDNLSPRAFEVLYLLSNGLSQYDIAKKLKITRGTVLKTITERILCNLALEKNNSLEIIKIAIALGIHGKIPSSLVTDQIITIGS